MNENNQLTFIRALLMCGIYLLFIIVLTFIVVIYTEQTGLSEESPFFFFLINILVPTISITLLIYLTLKKVKANWRDFIGRYNGQTGSFLLAVLLTIGVGILLFEIDYILTAIIPVNADLKRINSLIISGDLRALMLITINFLLVCPIVEEFLFRGILLRGLMNKLNTSGAIVLSSLVFALIHLNIHQGFSAFFVGIILGWLFVEFNSLYLVVFLHIIHNGVTILLIKYLSVPSILKPEGLFYYPLWLIFAGLTVTAFSSAALVRVFRKREKRISKA